MTYQVGFRDIATGTLVLEGVYNPLLAYMILENGANDNRVWRYNNTPVFLTDISVDFSKREITCKWQEVLGGA